MDELVELTPDESREMLTLGVRRTHGPPWQPLTEAEDRRYHELATRCVAWAEQHPGKPHRLEDLFARLGVDPARLRPPQGGGKSR